MIAAAVPLKALPHAKGRLSKRLDESARTNLVVRMLHRTLRALLQSGVVDTVALVTAERHLDLPAGIQRLPDRGGLNPSLVAAAAWATERGAAKLLILPADLPQISAESVRHIIRSHNDDLGVALARTQDGGTGALLLAPPDAIPPAFGPGSFARHEDLALARGIPVCRILDRAFTFDLDTSEDLAQWAGSL